MKKVFKIAGWIISVLVLVVLGFAGYVVAVSSLEPPAVEASEVIFPEVEYVSDTDRRAGPNHLFLNEFGNWEMYIEGDALERGIINGKLSGNLLYQQEKHFTDQIRKMVPNESYLNFLKYFVGFFNRNMDEHVPEEYQREIYGVSLSAPDEFDFISGKYDRMMNYHAAHDIGHALQNLALVGCTSFAADGGLTKDGKLISGRNFDFYVGDGFAENKIVALVKPDSGYGFLSVTWPGMIGVVSGMNEAGLSITLNAAPSEVPSSSATPISILAREILQYAGTIDEAMEIARSRKTFVSESLMISSAADGEAVLIEKTPHETALFRPGQLPLVCSNHFQSEEFYDLPRNEESIRTSDSPYRFELMSTVLDTAAELTPQKVVDILRHRGGLNTDSLGLGNPMSINQLIAHHGIVFQPEDRLVWVSSSPYQLGAFAAYDLKEIFGSQPVAGSSMAVDSLTIPASNFIETEEFARFNKYRVWLEKMKATIGEEKMIFSEAEVDAYLALNPHYYLGYLLAGEYFLELGENSVAAKYLEEAQEKKFPYASERRKTEELIKKATKRES